MEGIQGLVVKGHLLESFCYIFGRGAVVRSEKLDVLVIAAVIARSG